MLYFGVLTVVVAIIGSYMCLLFWLYFGLTKTPVFNFLKVTPKTDFSIIIAFRNEAENLPRLLQSLSELNYPKNLFEMLFVDDASSDISTEIIQEFITNHPKLQTQLLQNNRKSVSPKKDAITTAIKQAKYEWILTTDADCKVPENWLANYDAYIAQKKAVLVAGLVSYKQKKGFLYHFQQLDWASLVGTTIGSFAWKKPIMCSGANLAYKKESFNNVKGFQGNEHIASGDDVFLLQKMNKKYPNQVFFMNSPKAMVKTQALTTWKKVFQQRIRWAKKTSNIPSVFTKFVGICVFLMNLSIVLLGITSLIYRNWIAFFVLAFVLKIVIDLLFLQKTTYFLETENRLKYYISGSILYPFFSISVVFASLFSKYNWKGRNFSK